MHATTLTQAFMTDYVSLKKVNTLLDGNILTLCHQKNKLLQVPWSRARQE